MLMLRRYAQCLMGVAAFILGDPLQAQDQDLVDRSRAQRYQLVEQARIGGNDQREPYALSLVPDVALLPEREVAVIDVLAKDVRIFGSDGVLRRRFGGPGDGPGEFQTPLFIVPISGDRLLIWDPGRGRRTHVVTSRGEHVATHLYEPPANMSTVAVVIQGQRMQAPAWVVQGQLAGFGGAFSDGRVLLRGTRPPSTAPGPRRDTAQVVVYDPVAKTSTLIGTVAGGEYTYSTVAGMGHEQLKLFKREFVTAVVGDEIFLGSTGDAVIHRRSATGANLGSWQLSSRNRAVSQSDVRLERDSRLAELSRLRYPPDLAAGLRESAEQADWHPTLPAFRSILPGDSGTLWIEDYPRPAAQTVRWYQLRAGTAISWFDAPVLATIQAIGQGLVVHTEKDMFDVVSVVVSRLAVEP